MRRLILLLVLALSGLPSQADNAPLGRLFFDAQQRAYLDQQRQRNPWFGQQHADDTEAGLTFNGEVRSSSGRRTRWINGEADWNNASPAPRVPVGNTYYPESGQSDSPLGGGRIVVQPARPVP
ncbi:MAG TPA: hypothetical protein VK165_12535 [Azonexus sp.]|nr:hypothetical protein [Azonexus sp.]